MMADMIEFSVSILHNLAEFLGTPPVFYLFCLICLVPVIKVFKIIIS